MGIGPERDAYPNFVSHRARLVELACNFKHTSADAYATAKLKKRSFSPAISIEISTYLQWITTLIAVQQFRAGHHQFRALSYFAHRYTVRQIYIDTGRYTVPAVS